MASTQQKLSPKMTLASLPLDVKYLILQRIDSFASLEALLEASKEEEKVEKDIVEEGLSSAGLDDILTTYTASIHASISATEFEPLLDGLVAVGIVDAACRDEAIPSLSVFSSNSTASTKTPPPPYLVQRLDELMSPTPPADFSQVVDDATRRKLHALTTAANGLAELYVSKKQHKLPREEGLLREEVVRFRRAVFRCVTFFELYKERKGWQALRDEEGEEGDTEEDEDEDEDGEGEMEEGKAHRNRYAVRNTFLRRFTHQEVLEMDCVREFMTELAQEMAEFILEGVEFSTARGEQGAGPEVKKKEEVVEEYGTKFEDYAKTMESHWGWGGLDVLNMEGKKESAVVVETPVQTCNCIISNSGVSDGSTTTATTTNIDNTNTTTTTTTTTPATICIHHQNLLNPTSVIPPTAPTTTTTTPSPPAPPSTTSPTFLHQTLLLMGPIPLYHLHKYLNTHTPSPCFPTTIYDSVRRLAPEREREIFDDEVYRYWAGAGRRDFVSPGDSGVGGGKDRRKRKLPKGFVSVYDVMMLEWYELAVVREGRVFEQ